MFCDESCALIRPFDIFRTTDSPERPLIKRKHCLARSPTGEVSLMGPSYLGSQTVLRSLGCVEIVGAAILSTSTSLSALNPAVRSFLREISGPWRCTRSSGFHYGDSARATPCFFELSSHFSRASRKANHTVWLADSVSLLGKTCGTFTARMGLFIAMDPLVDPEVVASRETLPAFVAAERFYGVMGELVSSEAFLDSELSGTQETPERLTCYARFGANLRSRRIDEFRACSTVSRIIMRCASSSRHSTPRERWPTSNSQHSRTGQPRLRQSPCGRPVH